MDFNSFDNEEIDLYDAYFKHATEFIKDELAIKDESIEIMNIETPKNEQWVFLVKKFSYKTDGISNALKKYLRTATSEEASQCVGVYETIHTISVVSYHKWRLMVRRNKRLEDLLKNNNKNA